MAKQTVNIGSSANDGTGDQLRTAFDKINDNFDELYARSVPTSGVGTTGDVAGMIAVDSSYLYVCTGTYDGTTAIWKKVALGAL
jgi:hypothetical protein